MSSQLLPLAKGQKHGKKAGAPEEPVKDPGSKPRWEEVSVSKLDLKMRTEGLRASFGPTEVLKGISLNVADK